MLPRIQGVILPNTTARFAPVAEGRFDGLRRHVTSARTANAMPFCAGGYAVIPRA